MNPRITRNQKLYVHEQAQVQVWPLDCVPDHRPQGSWTNGVLAWEKGLLGAPDQMVGWFAPPRLRQKRSKQLSAHMRENASHYLGKMPLQEEE
jgi:hypothetical protein